MHLFIGATHTDVLAVVVCDTAWIKIKFLILFNLRTTVITQYWMALNL